MTGTLFNAQVNMTMFQEKGVIYGTMQFLGGASPLGAMTLNFSGEMDPSTNGFVLQMHSTLPLTTLTMYMPCKNIKAAIHKQIGDSMSIFDYTH